MKYATGCAFNMDEMFMNFPYSKLKFTCELALQINNNLHRNILVKKIFRECVKKVLTDIIENNIVFTLPTLAVTSELYLKRIEGKDFSKARLNGKFKEINFLKSYFSGYEIEFKISKKNGITRTKNVYVNKDLKDKIIEITNSGNPMKSILIKKVLDYYEYILLQFPLISKLDIKRILNYGWKSLYLHNNYGGDTIVSDSSFWCYIGTLRKDSLKHFKYYINKLSLKLRILYKRLKITWDGYYYFALTDNLYNQLQEQNNKRGRKRKLFNYGNQVLYKLLDECKIKEYNKKYIFKTKSTIDLGFSFYKELLLLNNAELIINRDIQKFKDILITNNEYLFI